MKSMLLSNSSKGVALGLLLGLVSCATPPERIVATSYPSDAYKSMSCELLLSERASKQNELVALSSAQTAAANTDALGVFLFGVPLGSLGGGDKEAQVSITKGKVEAIDHAVRFKGC